MVATVFTYFVCDDPHNLCDFSYDYRHLHYAND